MDGIQCYTLPDPSGSDVTEGIAQSFRPKLAYVHLYA